MSGLNLLVICAPGAPHLALLERLPPGTRVTTGDSAAVLEASAGDADAVLNCGRDGKLLEQLWPRFRRLRWVHSLAAGVEAQLFPALVASPVPLTNARGVYRESLGEFALAAALFFAKDFRRLMRNQAAGRWEPFDVEMLSAQTLGIVGYGEIGRAVARRAKALGMRVLAARRRVDEPDPEQLLDGMFASSDRRRMIAECDYLVCCAPLTPQTCGFIGAAEIGVMKPSAVLMNIGRGPVVEEGALIEALQSRRIRGAALDVFDTEPLPSGHPFWSLDNVLLSPHSADHIEGWIESSLLFFLDNFARFAAGEPLRNVVNKEAGY